MNKAKDRRPRERGNPASFSYMNKAEDRRPRERGDPASFSYMNKVFYVYILASQRNGTLYIGVTSNLIQRVWQHREDFVEGFTKEHGVKQLVWYEQHENAESAISREKQLKQWNRAWKIELIEARNPYWNDLYAEITV